MNNKTNINDDFEDSDINEEMINRIKNIDTEALVKQIKEYGHHVKKSPKWLHSDNRIDRHVDHIMVDLLRKTIYST